jgi:hypothetical protein
MMRVRVIIIDRDTVSVTCGAFEDVANQSGIARSVGAGATKNKKKETNKPYLRASACTRLVAD